MYGGGPLGFRLLRFWRCRCRDQVDVLPLWHHVLADDPPLAEGCAMLALRLLGIRHNISRHDVISCKPARMRDCSHTASASAKGDMQSGGRRLAEAETYIKASLGRGLTEALTWNVDSFGCSADELQQLLVTVRSSYTLATKRFEYVGLLPWLLTRLPEAGIKQRCLTQYEAYTKHHPITHKFLKPGELLRDHVDSVRPDGTGISSLLQSWIDMLRAIPMDDSIAEAPHAVGNRLGRAAPRSGIAWAASSMRLTQNLDDVKLHSQALGTDLQ